MSEVQIHNVDIVREDLSRVDTGGAFRCVQVTVTVDSSLPKERQRECVIHEILGAYLGSVVPTDTLAEIAQTINEALGELEN